MLTLTRSGPVRSKTQRTRIDVDKYNYDDNSDDHENGDDSEDYGNSDDCEEYDEKVDEDSGGKNGARSRCSVYIAARGAAG